MKYAENVIDGLENTPKAFIGLSTGENPGKQIVRVVCNANEAYFAN